MPIVIDRNIPAYSVLQSERIVVMDRERATSQDIRPIEIAILNLMPTKKETETQFMRLLSNSPLQVNITLIHTQSYRSRNTEAEYLGRFYKSFEDVKERHFDGMIVTGAPVEDMAFSSVAYWEELVRLFDWTQSHVTSTIFICWGAMAALHHFYGIEKRPLQQKLFGVFTHHKHDEKNPIFRGFDDRFEVPHSRYSEVRRSDIERNPELTILSESEEAGVYIVMARGGREFFITGHSEYSALTLDIEYRRDRAKGLDIALPRNYYPGDNPDNPPVVTWRGHANLLFTNWLNYFVYQQTPYNLNDIR